MGGTISGTFNDSKNYRYNDYAFYNINNYLGIYQYNDDDGNQ